MLNGSKTESVNVRGAGGAPGVVPVAIASATASGNTVEGDQAATADEDTYLAVACVGCFNLLGQDVGQFPSTVTAPNSTDYFVVAFGSGEYYLSVQDAEGKEVARWYPKLNGTVCGMPAPGTYLIWSSKVVSCCECVGDPRPGSITVGSP